MRTPKQIENLKSAMRVMYGPFVTMFVSDQDVNDWANRLQNDLDDIQGTWEVKVRLNSQRGMDWDQIEDEPILTSASLSQMRKKCSELLDKYPAIDSLHIREHSLKSDIYIFGRD